MKQEPFKQSKRKCQHCGEWYWGTAIEQANRQKTYYKNTCKDRECEIESQTAYALQQVAKQKTEKQKQQTALAKEKNAKQKTKDRATREALKSASEWMTDLQKKFNPIIRQIDKYQPCIARPHETSFRFDSGHCFAVGGTRWLRYWVHNVHKQSSKSNGPLAGDTAMYIAGMIARYDNQYWLDLQDAKDKYREYNVHYFTKDNLKVWYQRASKLLTHLKKGHTITREELHNELRIYHPNYDYRTGQTVVDIDTYINQKITPLW